MREEIGEKAQPQHPEQDQEGADRKASVNGGKQ
jgi:hypothetical protein